MVSLAPNRLAKDGGVDVDNDFGGWDDVEDESENPATQFRIAIPRIVDITSDSRNKSDGVVVFVILAIVMSFCNSFRFENR